MKSPSFTFAGGVFSSGLYGRVDLAKYSTGLRSALNFIIAVEGGAAKRNGFYLTGFRKFQESDKPAKLIPWRIANDDSYMLEVGDEYIRFIRFGGYVTIPGGHVHHVDNQVTTVGGVMELASPYAAADVGKIKFTSANDILYLNHPDYPEQQLTRLGLYDWKIEAGDFEPHPSFVGTLTLTYNDNTIPADNYDVFPQPIQYAVSATLADGTETKRSPIAVLSGDLGHRRTYMVIDWPAQTGAIQYTIYKGANGILGFIGYVDAPVVTYTDRNFAPSYDVVPLKKRFQFPVGEYPGVSEFYKQRKLYSGIKSEPQRIIGSKPLLFNSLYTSIPSLADDAIDVTLVGRERHTINHMVELKKFIIFTDSAEWVLGTEQNAPLTGASIDPTIETKYGADAYLRPIVIGERILFVQDITGSIRDMGYEFTADSFKADDLSRLARDLFKDKYIVAWDSAPYPLNLVPCVMSDGTINTLTYAREHEVWGWTQLTTQGEAIDVAAVAEIDEHGLYIQVKRELASGTTYTIERLEVPKSSDLRQEVFADCALTYDTFYEFSDGELLTASTFQFTKETAAAYSVNDEIELTCSDGKILIGKVISTMADVIIIESFETSVFPSEGTPTGISRERVSAITGFSYLDGLPIEVNADGKVYNNLVSVDGVITLPEKAAVIHVGLGYDAYIETLSIDTDGAKGAFQDRTIGDITLHLKNSRGVWAGPLGFPDLMQNVDSRYSDTNMYAANAPLNGVYELSSHPEWTKTAALRVESRGPLPCHVLNIVPDLKYGA